MARGRPVGHRRAAAWRLALPSWSGPQDSTLAQPRRAQRALAAAQAKHRAGAPHAALALLASAEAGPLDELESARADLLRAQVAFAVNRGRDAPRAAAEGRQAPRVLQRPSRARDLSGRAVGLTLAAFRGDQAQAHELFAATMTEVLPRGEGIGLTIAHWASALLCNSLGHYDDALAAAELASEHPEDLRFCTRALVELIEAAARSGQPERAADGLRRLTESTRARGTELALGTEARSRALLSEGKAAESLYREAIERLARTRVSTALARANLLYGEWLRRERRRLDARVPLRVAYQMFTTMGMEAFTDAQRASCWPRASAPAGGRSRRAAISLPRRPRSRGWPATGRPTQRSPPACSSAYAPWSGICAKSSPSSTSAPATNSLASSSTGHLVGSPKATAACCPRRSRRRSRTPDRR